MKRPSLEDTMMDIAGALALRSTCKKLCVGAVITDKRGRILGSGYNGVPTGMTHCIDVPCAGAQAPKGADLCEAVHAEANALLNCYDIDKATHIYVTHVPCLRCMKTLLNTPIKTIVYYHAANAELPALRIWASANRICTQI